MAVQVSPLAGVNLSAAGGFLTAEVYNLGCYSATDTAVLATPYDIGVTFTTGSRNNAGVILAIETSSIAMDRLLRVSLQEIMGTATISIANPCVVTFNSHGFSNGQPAMFSSTGALPTFSITSGKDASGNNYTTSVATRSSTYFAGNVATNTFNLYDTAAHAVAGGATGRITTSGTQSGTHTLYADRGVSENTASGLYNSVTNKYYSNIVPFAWAGYGITNAASKWRFHIFQYGGTVQNYTLRQSDATHPFFCEISGIAGTVANNDCVVAAGPVTVDVTRTLKGVLGTGDTAYANALIICKSATALTPTSLNENVQWGTGGAYTLTIDGVMVMGFHSGFRAGTSGVPITSANMGTLNFIAPTVGTISRIVDCENPNAVDNEGRMSIFIYGERPAVERATFVGNIANNATTFTTAASTGWKNGDRVCVGKVTAKGVGDPNFYTLNGDASGTTINITSGLSGDRTGGGRVFRLNGYGFKITGSASGSVFSFQPRKISNLILDGVELAYFGLQGSLSPTATALELYADLTSLTTMTITHCSYFGGTLSAGVLGVLGIPRQGCTVSYCNWATQNIISSTFFSSVFLSGALIYDNNWFCSIGSTTPVCWLYTNGVITNNVFENSGWVMAYLVGGGFTLNNNYFWGCSDSSGAINVNNVAYPAAWSSNTLNNNSIAVFYVTFSVALSSAGDIFGNEAPNTVDFKFASNSLAGHTYTNPQGDITVDLLTQRTTLDGSHLRFKHYNGTPNDFRAYYRQGRFVNPSQGASIQQVSNMATELLINTYYVSTGATAGFKFGAVITGHVDNAAYWGGVSTYPNFKLIYDVSSEVDSNLAYNTNNQTLLKIFTPTTSYNNIEVKLTTATDAVDANAGVVWSDLILNVRQYGYIFGSYPLIINQTTESYLANVIQPSANVYITQANPVTVAAYGEFSIDHATQTIVVSSSTTLKRLYDYTQYDLVLDANIGYAEWFTTIDGINYTSLYDITLNTGVSLTGDGSINIGALTFTKTGTATYDGIIITTTDRKVHLLLNNLVAGSTVQVYDNTTSTEIYSAVVTGTSLDYIFTWTVNNSLRVRVRQAGWIPYEYTGNITETGLTLNVSQSVDTVYIANGIVGSTVSELYLYDSTLIVYISSGANTTTGQRLYNGYMYQISRTAFIGLQPYDITAQSPWSYVLADVLKIYNAGANPLFISGANINNVSGNGQVIDTAGGEININGYFPFNSANDVAVTNRIEMDTNSTKLKTILGLSAAAASK